tara:strand:- start:23211 stop:23690 length:480 start_codon:yes stop_codon:yes gene_type:complete
VKQTLTKGDVKMLVKDIMSHFVTTIDEEASLKEAASKMRDHDIGCLLVSRDDNLSGIVTDRDITCKGVADGMDIDAMIVSDVMTRDVIWCAENSDVEDALHIMENNQIRRLPVLDGEKTLVGVLSIGDISTQMPHELSGEVIEAISKTGKRKPPMTTVS